MRTIASRFKKFNSGLAVIGSKRDGQWRWTSQNDMHNYISGAIETLKYKGVKSGDRVLYKGSNSLEWVSWNIATNAMGAIWVPMYKEQTLKQINHIKEDCSPKLFISDENTVDSIDNKIKPYDKDYSINTNDWDISTIIYTSGTSGPPKGVTLTNANILANIEGIQKRFIDDSGKRMTSLNILPWAHIFGLTTELYYNILNNNCIAIAEDKTKFVKNLREINPNYIYVVPRVLKLIKDKCKHLEKLPFSDIIIPKALSYIFGENIHTIFVGGSKLDINTALFFEKHGFNPCEGYGTTETSPVVAVNHRKFPRDINSVGKLLDNVEVITENDEILVSGPSVMSGYWNNKDATEKSIIIKDGRKWYKTGDSGFLSNDRFLYFKGRESDNYKMSNGKFVDVHEVETEVKKHIEGHFIVWGDNMDYNLLISDIEVPYETLCSINENLESHMKLSKSLTVSTKFFEESMTNKLSIKRKEFINNIRHLLITI